MVFLGAEIQALHVQSTVAVVKPINRPEGCVVVPKQAAVEEGIVIGGGCTFLKLAQKVEAIKETLENDEQKVRAGGCCGAQQGRTRCPAHAGDVQAAKSVLSSVPQTLLSAAAC